ncbi:unnamed protein product [Owenia fusiformis]|uniref:Uncharacterized protein n=1 Tax=Owenia fusiformis TaxID=6347 RepID=A0A8S4MZA4_OWEFU|nr:unnamed protein product [Owenia fusiformis]
MGGVLKTNTPDLMKKLSQMQESDIMCDLAIRLQDGIDFHVHRLLFCALSTMIMETCADLPPDHVNDPKAPWILDFTGTGLTVETMSNVVHYVYGRTIDLEGKEKIDEMKQAASILGMPTLIRVCEQQNRVAKVSQNKVLNMKDIIAKKMLVTPPTSAKKSRMESETDIPDFPGFEEPSNSGVRKIPQRKRNYCAECNVYFKSSDQHIEHMKRHRKKSVCNKCGRIFAKREWLDDHLRTCGIKRCRERYNCIQCNKYFHSAQSLGEHIDQKHKEFSDDDTDALLMDDEAELQTTKKRLRVEHPKQLFIDGEAIICEKDNTEWPLSSYTVYLRNFDKVNVSTKPPNRPKGGDMFVFNTTQMTDHEWRLDGYDWKKQTKSQAKTLTKVHYIGDDQAVELSAFRNPAAPNRIASVPSSGVQKKVTNESRTLHLIGDHTFAATPSDSDATKELSVESQQTDNAVASDNDTHVADETTAAPDDETIAAGGDTAVDDTNDVSAVPTDEIIIENTAEVDNAAAKVISEVIPENIVEQSVHTSFQPVHKGNGAILIGNDNRMLVNRECASFLSNLDESIISLRPPLKPLGGEMYVFSRNHLHDKDWRCDGYNWVNTGLRSKTWVRKIQFNIKTQGPDGKPLKHGSSAFRKMEYTLVSDDTLILVHYLGDESVYVPMGHGNSKKRFVEHQRTRPSMLHKIKTLTENNTSSSVFNVLSSPAGALPVSEITLEPEVVAPRSLKQVQNHKYTKKKKDRDAAAAKNIVHIMQTEDSRTMEAGSQIADCVTISSTQYQKDQTAQQVQQPFIVFSTNVDQTQ